MYPSSPPIQRSPATSLKLILPFWGQKAPPFRATDEWLIGVSTLGCYTVCELWLSPLGIRAWSSTPRSPRLEPRGDVTDAMLQMWAAYCEGLAHGHEGMRQPFTCVTPNEVAQCTIFSRRHCPRSGLHRQYV